MTDSFENELSKLGITLEEFVSRYLEPWAKAQIEAEKRFISDLQTSTGTVEKK